MPLRIGASVLFVATLVVSWVLGGYVGYRQVEQESLEESFRYRQLVANELNRYLPIPELMAEHPVMEQALLNPDDSELILAANQEMQRMATIVGSSDVYLMNAGGLTIAANNYQERDSFVGRRFDFRPYFSEAMATGDSAVYFALGTTSGIRGLYFSHPVRAASGDLVGVVAVKVLVHELESQWHRPAAKRDAEMVVLDRAGISFLSSRDDWLYRDFSGGHNGALPLESRRRYPDRELRPMRIEQQTRPWGLSEQSERIRLMTPKGPKDYLNTETPLPRLDWTLRVMVSTDPVLVSRVGFMLAGTALFFGVLLAWLYVRERSRREAELA
ncbi:MAG: two-component system, NtrC family, C4-dicarboxylate transport sensor histidine kinase DctB, partial [Marinobacter sp. T13-3]